MPFLFLTVLLLPFPLGLHPSLHIYSSISSFELGQIVLGVITATFIEDLIHSFIM